MRKKLLGVLAVGVILGCRDGVTPTGPAQPEPGSSSQAGAPAPRDRTVIVTLSPTDDPEAVLRGHGLAAVRVYRNVLRGFAAALPDAALAALSADPRVLRVEADGPVGIVGEQTGAPWGLDRVDQRGGTLDGLYRYDLTGQGVDVYVVDTGIRYSHSEFGGRALSGFDAFAGDGSDCHGHGTHVAGTAGGATYGVAKGATLVSVRVLDCRGSGTISGVVAGLDWIAGHATGPSVANLSLGGAASATLDQAVASLVAAGVATVVAAGNNAADACGFSPARAPAAMTVAATERWDNRAAWSNYGSCVDWFAPGGSVTSAYYSSDVATATMSGTSMATPHTAGAAALLLEALPAASPATVRDSLFHLTTKGVVTSASSANAHLLYAWISGTPGDPGSQPANDPPTADFVEDCAELACAFQDGSSDPDGSLTGWSWSFGDGASSSTRNPAHGYAAPGTYRVRLTVTDDAGATSTAERDVSVTEPAGGISLTALGYKVRGRRKVDLAWSGALGSKVEIHRDGVLVADTANDGVHTDSIGGKGGGQFAYRVCETGGSVCSATVLVAF